MRTDDFEADNSEEIQPKLKRECFNIEKTFAFIVKTGMLGFVVCYFVFLYSLAK